MDKLADKGAKNSAVHKFKFKCAICPYSTKYSGHSKKHARTHSHEKPFECPECPFKTKWKENVNSHMKNVHLLQPPTGTQASSSCRPFPCPESGCTYAATQKSTLGKHSKVHSAQKPLVCSHPNCNFSTNHKNSLVSHVRIHSGEKPWVCQFESCSFATAHSNSLLSHSRTHTKERPFKCPEVNCGFSTAHKPHLRKHQLTHPRNPNPGEGATRPSFSCPLCSYSGTNKELLTDHIKRHTLEKPFKCDEPHCNFEARSKTQMITHKLVHSDEKPWACSFESCGYRSKRKCHLGRHLMIHSKEKRYKCELCPFRAKLRDVVNAHLKNVHSELESDVAIRPFKCPERNCTCAFKSLTPLNRHRVIHETNK